MSLSVLQNKPTLIVDPYPHIVIENALPIELYEKLDNGQIKVINRCRMYASDGELNEAIGKATIVDKRTNAKLKVQFFWPFKGDYWIIDLDKNYQYAVVSEPARQYLWILSRSPNIDHQILEKLKNKIRDRGFDLSYLKKTLQ